MKPNISRVLVCLLGYLLMSMLPLVLRATQPTDLLASFVNRRRFQSLAVREQSKYP